MASDWTEALSSLGDDFASVVAKRRTAAMIAQLMGTPQFNPVQVTPQVSGPAGSPQVPGATPITDPARAAALSAPVQSFSGPLGSQIPFDQASALAPMLKGLSGVDPSIALPLLLQTYSGAMQRKQNIADRAITPLSDQEASGLGLRPGGVYGKDISGNISTIQPSDMKSSGAIGQINDQNRITPLTNQNDPRLPPINTRVPGTTYGTNAAGNIVPMVQGDAKSPLAEQQAEAERAAAMKEQMAMYGLGSDGTGPFDATKPLSGPYEDVAKSIANYDRSEATALSRYPAAIRATIQARVKGINPDYSQPDYNSANATKLAFAKGPQAQSIQSLNSTISHMDLMKQYVTALNNGDVQTINALKNAISTEFGGTAPTNAQAVAEILGPEMAKAVLPNGGTGPEREGFVNTLKQKASQGQLVGTLDTYQGLMAGQLLSLKKRYMAIPGHPKDFEGKFLLPETQHILSSRPEYQGGVVINASASPAPSGGPAPGAGPAPAKITGDADYNKLPPGAIFVGPDGIQRRKP